ncbi:hypothetical protein BDZ94DRAFT_1197036 [Collybia nuda]|uniref:C3H1-type domain-containing protein n=1 Tax=Collybia nuda TaxID=64659 RepID=A0A9P5Y1B4_9AGAR|nr:hypothetical protein BDZ94DRAFT_1197036 [Collybia nuda]
MSKPSGGPSTKANRDSAAHAHASHNASPELTEEMKIAIFQRVEKRLSRKEDKAEKIEELKNEGNQKFKQGDYSGAGELYTQAIIEYGAKGLLHSNLAAVYLKLELFEDADKAATIALSYEPKNIKARFRRGMARKAMGRLSAALADFETITSADPNNREAGMQEEMVLLQLMEEEDDDDGDDDGDDESSDYEWPHYDEELENSSSDESDTSDCNHIGNGVSCRFYNHQGCTKGMSCRFSHAPDSKSVRDRLGKNVCLYFLLDRCKFGGKCIYSYSKTCLFHGWWDHEEYVKNCQDVIDSMGIGPEDQEFVKFVKAISNAHDGQGIFSTTAYTGFTPPRPMKGGNGKSKAAAPTPESSKPTVMLLALEDDGMFSQYNKALYNSLYANAKLLTVVSANEALQLFASSEISAVFAPDAAITKRKNAAVLAKLVEFSKMGGSVVVGGSFSSFVRPVDLDAFFDKAWGLPWKGGSYHRTTFSLNQSHPLAKNNPSLLKSCSMKALHVQGITLDVAMYLPTEDSILQSLVWVPEKITDLSESPIAHIAVGKGHFGYVGDVNGEDGSVKATLAMLGLLNSPLKSTPIPTSQAKAARSPSPEPVKGKKAEDSGPSREKSSSKPTPAATRKMHIPRSGPPKEGEIDGATQAKASPQPQPTLKKTNASSHAVPPSASQPKHKPKLTNPFILVLSLENEDFFESTHKHLLSMIREKMEWKQALTAPVAMAMLTSPDLAGVFVADPGIVRNRNAHVLAKLVEFVKNGGSAVVGGLFSIFVSTEEINSFFADAWGLRWKSGSYHRTNFARNSAHDMVKKNPSLENTYTMTALYVGGVDLPHPVYLPVPEHSLRSIGVNIEPITVHTESPVVQARIGKGYLGYVGDTNAEVESTNTILAMLGLLDTPNEGEAETTVEPTITEAKVPKVPPKKTSRPFMMILSFNAQNFFTEHQSNLLSTFRAKLEVLHGLSNERVVDLLTSSDLVGILVTDVAIANPENAYLLARLVEYTKAGGTVIVGGPFSGVLKLPDVATFFGDVWGLPWKAGDCTRTDITINGKHDFVKDHPSLPTSFTVKALHLSGITPSMAVYIASKGSHNYEPLKKVTQAPIVHTKVGEGYLGYLGDVGLGGSHTSVMLAMLGLD